VCLCGVCLCGVCLCVPRQLLGPRLRDCSCLCLFVVCPWQLLEPLELLSRSLCSVHDKEVADGSLLDFLRQAACFGLSLVKLDCRQESDRHTDAMDAITTFLGLGSYRVVERGREDPVARQGAAEQAAPVRGRPRVLR